MFGWMPLPYQSFQPVTFNVCTYLISVKSEIRGNKKF